MSRSVFGWDLPPGVTANDIEEAQQGGGKITEADLDTVEYYMGVCVECNTCTNDFGDSADAIFYLKDRGWELWDGSLYCPDCAELEKQRLEDEKEAA